MWCNNNYCSVVDLLGLVFEYKLSNNVCFHLCVRPDFELFLISILGSVLIVEGILCCRVVYICMHELPVVSL